MPRPPWKGRILDNVVYAAAVKPDEVNGGELPTLTLHRRNTRFSESAMRFFLTRSFQLYTGYDFISKVLDLDSIKYNVATLINTREVDVKHKTKQSKHQRKAASQGNARKKLINVSKSKGKMKNKVKRKIVRKR